jgi:hypothetical protein
MLQVLDGKPLKTNHFDSNFGFGVYFNSLVDVCETPFPIMSPEDKLLSTDLIVPDSQQL